jgi:hypothetical protein
VTDQDTGDDGRRDHGFLLGSWQVANRKLADVRDPGRPQRAESTTTTTTTTTTSSSSSSSSASSAAAARPLLANLTNGSIRLP